MAQFLPFQPLQSDDGLVWDKGRSIGLICGQWGNFNTRLWLDRWGPRLIKGQFATGPIGMKLQQSPLFCPLLNPRQNKAWGKELRNAKQAQWKQSWAEYCSPHLCGRRVRPSLIVSTHPVSLNSGSQALTFQKIKLRKRLWVRTSSIQGILTIPIDRPPDSTQVK